MTTQNNFEPSPWIVKNLKNISKNCNILDLACGYGRHSIYAKKIGLNVTAADIDNIAVLILDIEKKFNWPFKKNIFDAVMVTNYLYRPIFKKIFHSIKSKGFLLYETFSEENIKFGPPKNTNYLLKSGELLNLANKNRMTIIEYEEIITQKKKPKAIQRIFAKIK